MTAVAIILVFLGIALLLGGGALLAVYVSAWFLLPSLLIFFALFTWYGCLPHGSAKH